MFKFLAMGVFFSTSHLKMGDLECEGEVGGDGEGDLLSEWSVGFDLLPIHSSCPPSSAKNVGASKIAATTSGKTTQARP